jgi:hypothetical protein
MIFMLSASTRITAVHTSVFKPVRLAILQIANIDLTTEGVGLMHDDGDQKAENSDLRSSRPQTRRGNGEMGVLTAGGEGVRFI